MVLRHRRSVFRYCIIHAVLMRTTFVMCLVVCLLAAVVPAAAQVDISIGFDNVHGKTGAIDDATGIYASVSDIRRFFVNFMVEGGIASGRLPFEVASSHGEPLVTSTSVRHITALVGARIARPRGTTPFVHLLGGVRTFTLGGDCISGAAGVCSAARDRVVGTRFVLRPGAGMDIVFSRAGMGVRVEADLLVSDMERRDPDASLKSLWRVGVGAVVRARR
jgi:hypothetical protein